MVCAIPSEVPCQSTSWSQICKLSLNTHRSMWWLVHRQLNLMRLEVPMAKSLVENIDLIREIMSWVRLIFRSSPTNRLSYDDRSSWAPPKGSAYFLIFLIESSYYPSNSLPNILGGTINRYKKTARKLTQPIIELWISLLRGCCWFNEWIKDWNSCKFVWNSTKSYCHPAMPA